MASATQLDLLNRPSGRTAFLFPSGFILDLLEPDATGMPITDIALCLSGQPRWGGGTRPWYSVAEHSVLVSQLVPPAHALDALMHDAEEFQGDWPSPTKVMLGREHVKAKMAPIKTALGKRFGYRPESATVKQADLVAMATELRDLLPPAWMDWGHLPPPASEKIQPVGPERAYILFLERYEAVKHLAAPLPAPIRPGTKRRASQ